MEHGREQIERNEAFEMELEEDVGTAIEDFILYSRLGLLDDAYAVINEVLWRHLLFFPALAEIGLFLVERCDMKHLRQILALLQRRKSDYLESYTADEKVFVGALEIVLSLEETLRSTLSELPSELETELLKLSLYDEMEERTSTQIQIVQMNLILNSMLSPSFKDFLEAAGKQFHRLVDAHKVWEPTHIFKLLCSKVLTLIRVNVTPFIAQLNQMYETIMLLVDETKLSSLPDVDVDENIPELICCMVAKLSFARTITCLGDMVSEMPTAPSARHKIRSIRAAAKRLFLQLLSILPDRTVRGIYTEFLGLLDDTMAEIPAIDGATKPQHVAEYSSSDLDFRNDHDMPPGSPLTSGWLTGISYRRSVMESIPAHDIPNIVTFPRLSEESKSLTSPAVAGPLQIKREKSDSAFTIRDLETTSLQHFRDVVWKQLIPAEHGPDASIVLLDEAAAQFPPLTLAMMAVGSLAMSEQAGRGKFDSLGSRYQSLMEARNLLNSDKDLTSDGFFLTLFLVSVYKIATADFESPKIWFSHTFVLREITLLRRRLYGAERLPFVVWWICGIDLDALLSGFGSGEFVEHMLKNDLIPPPSFHLYPLGGDGSSIVYPEETDTLPKVLQLNHEVALNAIRLGLLANKFRTDTSFENLDAQQRDGIVKTRQRQILDIQEELQHIWAVPAAELIGMRLSGRAQQLFHRAWTLSRACIIYSHTSMWPSQKSFMSSDSAGEIAVASGQILDVSRMIVQSDPSKCRFLGFPLFMAGFASKIDSEKRLALYLMQQMQSKSFGKPIEVVYKALKAVYERQNEQFIHTGNSLAVDWLELMKELGLTVINFGL